MALFRSLSLLSNGNKDGVCSKVISLRRECAKKPPSVDLESYYPAILSLRLSPPSHEDALYVSLFIIYSSEWI